MTAPNKIKNWPRPLFMPRTCPQWPNPSRETDPLSLYNTILKIRKASLSKWCY